MSYNKIRKMDISNGVGIRVSIFFQGCEAHCQGCFNPETWDFTKGKEFSQDTINTILDIANKDYIVGLSILGGEPLHEQNYEDSLALAKQFKERYPNKTVWLWTGYTYENIKNKAIFDYIDVLIDGHFEVSLKNPKLKYYGSTNQRIIDIKETSKKENICLWKE